VWIREQITVHDAGVKWIVEISGFSIISLEKTKPHEGIILHAKMALDSRLGRKHSWRGAIEERDHLRSAWVF
jgi:hypothetical protein